MKNAKFNNNRKISSSSNNSNYNKKQSQNNINMKENNKAILKKPTKQNIINNTNVSNNKNKIDAKLINKQQKNIKDKDSKINIEMKKNEQNANNKNENNKIIEEKKIKKIYYDLKLSKDEFNKMLINNNKSNNNNKIIPKTSKMIKSQSNDNLYRYNNEKVTLKNLNEKQKSLYELINSINSKKNYMKECSLNNLSENNIIYKNIQEKEMKSLDDEEKNALNKIDLIQRQINIINNQNLPQNESKNKDNKQKDYKSKFKKYKIENQKRYETNFKNADINLEKKLNDILLLEKNQKEQKNIELIEKIKRRHSLEKMHIEKMNLEEEKYKKYINSNNERGSAKNYLYFKVEKNFKEKEKKIMNDSKNKNRAKKDENDKDKEREEYLNKKRIEMKENINNLHKMWKERNFKLPKYRSPLFEKALLSEEDCKKFESDKLESKKLLYLNRENYAKEKIQLPPINILLRKENSQRIKLIKNLRTTLNKKDNFKTMRTNSVLDNNKIKSKLNISLGNLRKNQKQKQNKVVINISLKKKKTKDLKEPNDFNYLEDMKKERLLKNNSENYLFRNKNKASNQNMDIEKEKRDLVLLEQKYDMDKKLLRVKGGYINNIDLANKMNKMLLKSIENKLDIFENMVDK